MQRQSYQVKTFLEQKGARKKTFLSFQDSLGNSLSRTPLYHLEVGTWKAKWDASIAVDRRAAAEPRPPREPHRAAEVGAAPAPRAVRAAARAERGRDAAQAGGGVGQAGPVPHARRGERRQGQEVRKNCNSVLKVESN